MNSKSSSINTRIVLSEYMPKGVTSASYFSIDKSQQVPLSGSLADGQVLVKVFALSIDPHLRIYISAPEDMPSSDDPVLLYSPGKTFSSIGVGTVIASKSNKFHAGDRIRGSEFPWQEFAVMNDDAFEKLPSDESTSLQDYLGVLGMPSFTAYLGVVTIGQAKAGETLLVSAASGAVGQVVVQLAKARGLRVVGVAGSDDKTARVKSIGADAAINYKTCGDYVQAIKAAAPEGIDIYFDSVGGSFLDATLLNLNTGARVILCGSMTTFGADKSATDGIKNLDTLIVKEVTMKGLYYFPHVGTQAEADFIQETTDMVNQGKIDFKIDERVGLESAPQALVDLYEGKNLGKVIVRL
ncbi:hypothetical protein LPJ53_001425 [Coemansia erecta]|uniref:Enoyl reductase (ER) domain-containing protein n=1 Tax=Coemansia erecta TaxID=147472 RepID=A0A9W8CUJ5_9FUNG|nr:hypothetical protein LPJ53_001425 [Coemansia erecta]